MVFLDCYKEKRNWVEKKKNRKTTRRNKICRFDKKKIIRLHNIVIY